MTSNMFDGAVGIVFVGYLLNKYVASVLIRRLRDRHETLWAELGQPRVWQLLVTPLGNWRLLAFVWSGDATSTGDDELILCVRVIRVLTVLVFATTLVIIASVFKS
jgi:hypothetical protein